MIRRFLLAWSIARGFPNDSRWTWELWDQTDREWLRSVFSTPSGRKFHRLLDNEVAEAAIWAVNRKDSVRSCGYAAGVAYLVGLIEAARPQTKDEGVEEYDENLSMLDQ
jgi:hypothetical protein